ncbi:MAG: cytochrome c [Myxococcales bacterium]|nr:cytochrome c [Myxococcales bacterium]MCB9606775.1 cytochrome c [Polyangiaceae bacterium]
MRHVAIAACFALLACDNPSPAQQEPSSSAAPSATTVEAPAAAPAGDALDAMDQRKPVPLLPMMAHHQKQQMRDHLLAVQEIVTALATDDFSGVEKSAGRIGFSEGEAKMCEHMGAAAPGFTEQAIGFHKAADGIASAAKEQDRAKVLSALGATLKTCTSCHATWKQSVVSQEKWTELSGQAAPPGDGHHPMH